jgi:hypothetical protein
MKRILFAIGVSLLAATAVQARQIKSAGAGAGATCGTWLADRQSGNWYSLGNWALGFLSGMAASTDDLDPLDGLDSDAVAYWLDGHCQAHPLQNFQDVLTDFGFLRKYPWLTAKELK